MKLVPCLLVLISFSVSGCHHAKSAGSKSRTKPAATYARTQEEIREDRLRNVREITEPRAKTYERQGHSPEVARALAQAEYFRAGK
ncbi:MAG TPA: hypothetical protein VHO24_14710 [Opitutaceae bacterium]|nr:hypothetical protein [Opitutaceae bacterium]